MPNTRAFPTVGAVGTVSFNCNLPWKNDNKVFAVVALNINLVGFKDIVTAPLYSLQILLS